jgi:hypothetical protein
VVKKLPEASKICIIERFLLPFLRGTDLHLINVTERTFFELLFLIAISPIIPGLKSIILGEILYKNNDIERSIDLLIRFLNFSVKIKRKAASAIKEAIEARMMSKPACEKVTIANDYIARKHLYAGIKYSAKKLAFYSREPLLASQATLENSLNELGKHRISTLKIKLPAENNLSFSFSSALLENISKYKRVEFKNFKWNENNFSGNQLVSKFIQGMSALISFRICEYTWNASMTIEPFTAWDLSNERMSSFDLIILYHFADFFKNKTIALLKLKISNVIDCTWLKRLIAVIQVVKIQTLELVSQDDLKFEESDWSDFNAVLNKREIKLILS